MLSREISIDEVSSNYDSNSEGTSGYLNSARETSSEDGGSSFLGSASSSNESSSSEDEAPNTVLQNGRPLRTVSELSGMTQGDEGTVYSRASTSFWSCVCSCFQAAPKVVRSESESDSLLNGVQPSYGAAFSLNN